MILSPHTLSTLQLSAYGGSLPHKMTLSHQTLATLQLSAYEAIGSKKRNGFEECAQYFVISETLKDADMTQEELANKLGTKKSYISRLENGKCDIQLSTLYRIFEEGLGLRISLLIG